MSYQVIARKWRSQSFDQLIGQSHITTTLQNALKNNRLPHALLFTGPRGTGKTSSARILAKSLRCQNAKDFIPCHECTDCIEISLSRSPNVIEIDGASNNGVDAIRELRDTVAYAPSSGKFKIYIIDEVHMLSTSAFNALLKTLEEPPDHVIFIMATTEVHKIPQTILSRCQRFDFRCIPTRMIADHLKTICKAEKISAEDEALWMVARQGAGSMRDSQSLLDQVITFANGPLTRSNVVEILGLTDRALLLEMLTALVQRDSAAILAGLSKILNSGYEAHLFASDLLENLRHLLLVKASGESQTDLVELPDSEIRFLKDLSRQASEEDIHMLFDMALKGVNDISKSSDPRIVFEMLMMRMVAAPRVMNLQELFFSKEIKISQPTAVKSVMVGASAPVKASAQAPASAPTSAVKAGLSLAPQEKWYEMVQDLKSKDSLLGAKIENLLFISEKNKVIELGVTAKMSFLKEQMADRATREKLQAFVDQAWGAGYSLSIAISQDQTAGISALAVDQEKEQKRKQSLAEQVAAHPKVKAASQVFNAQIKTIKNTT